MLLPRSAPLEKNPPSWVMWPLCHSYSANCLRSVPCLCLWLHGAAKICVCLVKLCKWLSPLSYFAIFALQHFDLWRHRNLSVNKQKVFVPVKHGKAKIWDITVTNIRPVIALLLQLTAVLMRTESYKYESVFIWDTLLKLNYLFILFYKTINLFIMKFCQSPSYNWANACLHCHTKNVVYWKASEHYIQHYL